MSVRVVARIRPLLKAEEQKDVIVEATGEKADSKSIVKIPNPKNESEAFSFAFNSVYGAEATQQSLFENEVSPTVKHLLKGHDVTLFAYGVTGTGKTHTMRGGKSLAERGVIPRLLSAIYRRARKIEKDTAGETQVEVAMSYYEIYNDRVFDLFEPTEKRTSAGLPIRDNGGKTVVVGLTEQPCETLKEFEKLYDDANQNRSTSATKLNAHSSRSHAILCVKVTQTTGNETRVSTSSAIDLAGSEDNRRTDNNKDRLVESASINKSLFVLAQCVEAISKKQARIPYRESKMTRILSLGQNNGLTVMILNLAPMRSFHLDTLSSLNFANRTKKIEVNEVENQPYFRDPPSKKLDGPSSSAINGPSMNRQPLRPKLLSQNSHLKEVGTNVPKPTKQFAVYNDKPKPTKPSNLANTAQARSSFAPIKSPKRTSSEANTGFGRPSKAFRRGDTTFSRATAADPAMSKDAIEALIQQKVAEALAERADHSTVSTTAADPISDEVQKRLEALEQRVQGQESERAEGLQYLLMAKQHQVRGEEASALKMYLLALPFFPGNEKLGRKVSALQERIRVKKEGRRTGSPAPAKAAAVVAEAEPVEQRPVAARRRGRQEEDESYHEDQESHPVAEEEDEDDFIYRPRTKIRRPQNTKLIRPATMPLPAPKTMPVHPPPPNDGVEEGSDSEDELAHALTATAETHPHEQTPRTKRLLTIINTRDVSQIKLLKGVGAKKAEAIVNCLCDLDEDDTDVRVKSLGQLGKLKGVGVKTVENMKGGIVV